jgi:hypothetical protein
MIAAREERDRRDLERRMYGDASYGGYLRRGDV